MVSLALINLFGKMIHIYLYFSEISSLTFDFHKFRVCTLCLIKMTQLYPKIHNSVTNLLSIDFFFIDVDSNIYI